MLCIFLDFAKAFDTEILLTKLDGFISYPCKVDRTLAFEQWFSRGVTLIEIQVSTFNNIQMIK